MQPYEKELGKHHDGDDGKDPDVSNKTKRSSGESEEGDSQIAPVGKEDEASLGENVDA